VRLAGCNLRCEWCDTKYAQEGGEEKPPEKVLEAVKAFKCRDVCITGGEPLLQKETVPLIYKLLDSGHHVSLETNGTVSLQEMPCEERMLVSMDVKCPSSGMADKCDLANIEYLGPVDQLKFIIADERDYEYAKKVLKEHKQNCTVIMTPVGGTDLKWIAEKVLEDKLEVRVLPQLHKMIWGNKRGK